MRGQLMQLLYGFSSRVSGENGIVKPLVSSYVIVILSFVIVVLSYVMIQESDVIPKVSDVRIDNSSWK